MAVTSRWSASSTERGEASRSDGLSPTVDAYLDLLKRCLTASIYEESSHRPLRLSDIRGHTLKSYVKRLAVHTTRRFGYQLNKVIPFDPDARARGRDWPGFGYTMIGHKRLDNIQACIEDVLRHGVSGDLLEAGVWQGGAAIFMKAVLRQHGANERTVWLADSFEGMPVPKEEEYPADAGYDLSGYSYLQVDVENVKDNFRRFGLLDNNVKFLEGWFHDTLSTAPIARLALLRLDADLYESTAVALDCLYHRVEPGGYLIIDDYHAWPPCKNAIDEFRHSRGVSAPIQEIDGVGVFWQVP